MCEKTAVRWAAELLKDETARTAIDFLLAGVSVEHITTKAIPNTPDKLEVKRLVSQGELMELPNSQKLLVKLLTREPAHRHNRNAGRFGRLLGEEPVRAYAPLY